TTSCIGSVCAPVCSNGFKDCDGNKPNGCETDTTSDANNCGSCGNVCSFPNANVACSAGSCTITSCKPGYADCDLVQSNGCETPLNTLTDCGACGNHCNNPNGTTTCTAGACSPTCNAGYASCDGNPSNGCETPLNTTANCGGCGTL